MVLSFVVWRSIISDGCLGTESDDHGRLTQGNRHTNTNTNILFCGWQSVRISIKVIEIMKNASQPVIFPRPFLVLREHTLLYEITTNLSSSCPCLDWSVFTYYRRNYSAVIMIVNQAWRDANMKLCLVGFCHLLVQMYNCK